MFRVYTCNDHEGWDEQIFGEECDCKDKSRCGWREFADVQAACDAGWWFECTECGFRIEDGDCECIIDECSHPRHVTDCVDPSSAYHELEPCASEDSNLVWCSPECREAWRKTRQACKTA